KPSSQPLVDYRREPPIIGKPATKPLPLFGFDFFRPARDLIEARRAYLKKKFQGEVQEPDVRPSRAIASERERQSIIERDDAQRVSGQRIERRAFTQSGNDVTTERRSSEERQTETQRPVNAFEEVADPLTQLYRNVLASIPPTYQLAPGDAL